VSGPDGLWTAGRTDLLSNLSRVDPIIGGVYRRAVNALDERPRDMAGLSVAAHGVREIANALPDALCDVDGLPGRSDTSAPLRRLSERWEEHEQHLGDPAVSRTDSMATVPGPVLEAARVLVLAHRTGATNGHLRRGALVLGRLEDGRDVSVVLFMRSVNYFMPYVHLSGALSLSLPDEHEVLKHLSVIEEALTARVGRFFRTAEEILDIVEAANKRKQDD
jgi:hypothetical protein